MRKLFLIGLILGLLTSYSYAGKGEMMDQKEMMDKVREVMNQMSGIMARMPGMMRKVMPPPDVREAMFEIMKDMSMQLMDISKMMEKGTASDKEMKMMQDRMVQMQKRMDELEMK
ncbi:MAG: hypothetical protein HXY44_08080 [Syntrophaceae bacterium]|nr:hypothetical protein [Syntrophaceae bacterium]